MIADPQELYRYLAMLCIEMTNLLFAGGEVVWVTWRFVEEEDSVIYIQKCGQPPAVTCGDKLGDAPKKLGHSNIFRCLCSR